MKLRKAILGLAALAIGQGALADSADVVTIVDESGSMGTEHAWLPNMINALEAGIVGAGVGDIADGDAANQYAMVGFGSRIPAPRKIQVGGADFFDESDYAAAAGQLQLNGGTEDGYAGMQFFLDNYNPPGDATNIILVTDEDRDTLTAYNTVTFNTLATQLRNDGIILNVVVNATFKCDSGTGAIALGLDADGNGYIADGSGGFTTCQNAIATSGFGTTINDYVNLAIATGGAAWDLNKLRVTTDGGVTAASFTKAFVDIKVKEIQQQITVPEPGTLGLLGLGLLGLGFARRRSTS